MVIIPYFSVIDNHRKHVTLNLYLSYVRSNFMTDYEQIFLSSGQEKQKLTIALKRFIETEDPDWKARYQSYLRTRFRPAMTELIHGGDLARIPQFMRFCPADCSRTGTVYPGSFHLRTDRDPCFSSPVKKRFLRIS